MPVVYRHIRLDKNEPFYIGIGLTEKRAYDKRGRNKLWKNIVSKTNYEIDILFDNLSWDDACLKEKEFIYLYGRKDLGTGILVNMTDGGDGNQNFSQNVRDKISRANKGNKYGLGWNPNAEQRKKMSDANKGKPNKSKTKFKKNQIPWNIGTKGVMKANKTSFTKQNPPKAVKVYDIVTGKIYNTIREACIENELNEKAVCSMLKGKYKNKTNLRLCQ
jgi:hypothetical protein